MNTINRKSKDREIAFFGWMTAGISHELMNILAIIRERSGLIEDLMALDKKAEFPYRDKLAVALTSIREQVVRGMDVGESMNRLAHSMDEPRARLEVDDLLSRIAFMMQRFARLKKMKITVMPAETPFAVNTDPFRILLVLSACIEYCMERTEGGGEIVLQGLSMPEGVVIRFAVNRGAHSVDSAETFQGFRDRLRDPIEELKARIERLAPGDRFGLELTLA